MVGTSKKQQVWEPAQFWADRRFQCTLPDPGAAQAFHHGAMRLCCGLGRVPSPGALPPQVGRAWAQRAQTPTLGQLLLCRFGPLLPLGFHEFCADGPLVLAVMLQGGVGRGGCESDPVKQGCSRILSPSWGWALEEVGVSS